MMIVI
ncbi:Protein of unknown function [Pyronema omphalodes CBS 100304]